MKEVKGFAGRPLFEQANLHVRFQERAAIVGRNAQEDHFTKITIKKKWNQKLAQLGLVVV